MHFPVWWMQCSILYFDGNSQCHMVTPVAPSTQASSSAEMKGGLLSLSFQEPGGKEWVSRTWGAVQGITFPCRPAPLFSMEHHCTQAPCIMSHPDLHLPCLLEEHNHRPMAWGQLKEIHEQCSIKTAPDPFLHYVGELNEHKNVA